jgi:NAD(P)-dependent dehydrogenase (short-subunit alcohol dehydrogenase family)
MRDTIQRLFSLDDVVALVTGSSAGIGLALARLCGSWRARRGQRGAIRARSRPRSLL